MRAGSLRHRVTIQSLVAGSPQQTASGEPDVAWTDYLTGVSAEVMPLRGRELFAAQEHHSEITTRFRIRGSAARAAGITAAMRIVFKARYYNIRAILNRQERDIEIELLCTDGVNLG